MAEATRTLKFVPRCNGVLSRDLRDREAIPSVLSSDSPQFCSIRVIIPISICRLAGRGCCLCATVHWSLLLTDSSLKNYYPSQVLNNRRKISGIYNLTEIFFGPCHASQPYPLS